MRRRPLSEPLARAAATDAGNRAMRAAGRTSWTVDDYNAAVRVYERATRPAPEPVTCIQTSCERCGQDIENLAPFKAGQWMDRGGNYTCNGTLKHRPYEEPPAQGTRCPNGGDVTCAIVDCPGPHFRTPAESGGAR